MPIAGTMEREIEVPDEVQVTVSGDTIVVRGPMGELKRDFDLRKIKIAQGEGKRLVIGCEYPRMREKAMIGTIESHILNMIHGVIYGFEYKMKIVYSHFPIKVSVRGDTFVIENFLGERSPRETSIRGNTKIEVKGDDVTLTGISIEDVSQTAANIERATKIRGYDPRVFQDGIYITQKGWRGGK